MIRYTTPTQTVRVEGIDLTPYDVTVSLRQTIRRSENAHTVDIGSDAITMTVDGEDTLVTFTLTQAQSGGFVPGRVDVQINYGSGSTRMATSIVRLTMERNLLTEAVEFATATDPDTTVDTASVGIDSLAAGSVTTEKLADSAVTADKLADGAVTAEKLDVTLGYAVTDGDLTITIS